MELMAPVMIAGLIFSTPNKYAQQTAIIAAYKQTGLERTVNERVNFYVDKRDASIVGYTYKVVNVLQKKEVSIEFSF